MMGNSKFKVISINNINLEMHLVSCHLLHITVTDV